MACLRRADCGFIGSNAVHSTGGMENAGATTPQKPGSQTLPELLASTASSNFGAPKSELKSEIILAFLSPRPLRSDTLR